jgi:carbamoyltransferase
MKNFIATTINAHDPNWYDGEFHYISERYSRVKQDRYPNFKSKFFKRYVKSFMKNKDLMVGFTYTAGGLVDFEKDRSPFQVSPLSEFYNEILDYNTNFSQLWDYLPLSDNIYYINHHQSHAVYAYQSSGYGESDILAIDGGGINYSTVFFGKDNKKIDLSSDYPLGYLWNCACHAIVGAEYDAIGYNSGKAMGLAGYGKCDNDFYDLLWLLLESRRGQFYKYYPAALHNWSVEKGLPKTDIAATVQQFTQDRIIELVKKYKTSDSICLAGGVAYNGYMNELLTKHYDRVYVPPAVGDEGQALGTYMHMQYALNNVVHVPKVFNGKIWEIDPIKFGELEYKLLDDNELFNYVAAAIAAGSVVGWYQGASESGNRALGNRSILADPRDHNIKDTINHKIKFREDFRPFAPSVLEDHYKEYFDTNQPSPHMSRIVPVISDKIPGVTHIDGTSRIQTVNKEFNERFYNLINAFYKITGIPMLLNTSFNSDEPIVETPADALRTFKRSGVNMLVMGNYIIEK